MTQDVCEETLVDLFKTIDLYFWKEDTKQNLVSYEMEDFTKPTCGYWYEVKHLPNRPSTPEIFKGSMNRWSGVMQVNICVYKDIKTRRSTHKEYGVPFYMKNAYATITDVIKRGVIKDRVHITRVGKSSAIDNGDYYSVPISIYWYAHLTNE